MVHIPKVYSHLILAVLAFGVSACQPANVAVATAYFQLTQDATQKTQTFTLSPATTLAATLVPTKPESPPITLSKGSVPKFISGQGSYPDKSGIYLIYSNRYGSLDYVSMNEETLQKQLFIYTNQTEPVFVSSNQGSQLIFTAGLDENNSAFASIWVTDILGNAINNWDIQAKSNVHCFSPSFSPHGLWMEMECFDKESYTDRYINLANLNSGVNHTFHLAHCGGSSEGVNPFEVAWGDQETLLSYRCNPDEYCFISVIDDETNCKKVGQKILSFSPDWGKVVLNNGFMPENADGSFPGLQILVVDKDCVFGQIKCDQGIKFDLPFALPFFLNADNNLSPSLKLYWDHTGDQLAWMASSTNYQNGFHEGNFSVGWINLSRNTNQVLNPQILENIDFLGISPDQKLLLFQDSKGLYTSAIEDGRIHYLAKSNDLNNFIHFYGWLMVP